MFRTGLSLILYASKVFQVNVVVAVGGGGCDIDGGGEVLLLNPSPMSFSLLAFVC